MGFAKPARIATRMQNRWVFGYPAIVIFQSAKSA
jgi:hypothetical protein